MSSKHLLPITLFLSTLLACGGGAGSTPSTGTLTLKLGSDSHANYASAYVSIEKVEYKSTDSSSWSTLATINASYDLMALQNGHEVTLTADSTLKTGSYNVRITWGTDHNYTYPVLSPGTLLLAGKSSLLEDGLEMSLPTRTTATGSLTVTKDTATIGEIFIQGDQLAQKHSSLSTPYTFQATAELLDLSTHARILGQVTDAGGTGIAGAEVLAETLDGSLTATVKRRAVTDASGNFVLAGLAMGEDYYLATQPSGSALGYSATSTSPVTASAATDYSAALICASTATPGTLGVTISPASTTTQGTWVELRQTLATGAAFRTLVVRSQIVDTGSSTDTTSLTGLYPGSYGVTLKRSTSGGSPVATISSEKSVTAGSSASATITIN